MSRQALARAIQRSRERGTGAHTVAHQAAASNSRAPRGGSESTPLCSCARSDRATSTSRRRRRARDAPQGCRTRPATRGRRAPCCGARMTRAAQHEQSRAAAPAHMALEACKSRGGATHRVQGRANSRTERPHVRMRQASQYPLCAHKHVGRSTMWAYSRSTCTERFMMPSPMAPSWGTHTHTPWRPHGHHMHAQRGLSWRETRR